MNVYIFFVNWRIYQKILKVKVGSRLRLKKYISNLCNTCYVCTQCEKRRLESYNFSKFTQYSYSCIKGFMQFIETPPYFLNILYEFTQNNRQKIDSTLSVYLGTLRTITKQRKTNSAHRLIYYDVAVKGTRKFTKSNLYIYKAFAQLQAIIGRTSSNQWL